MQGIARSAEPHSRFFFCVLLVADYRILSPWKRMSHFRNIVKQINHLHKSCLTRTGSSKNCHKLTIPNGKINIIYALRSIPGKRLHVFLNSNTTFFTHIFSPLVHISTDVCLINCRDDINCYGKNCYAYSTKIYNLSSIHA